MMKITGLMLIGFTFWCLELTGAKPVTGKPVVIRSPGRIRATAGDDVTVSFHLEPPTDITDWTLELRLNDKIVHVYRNRKVDIQQQDERFTDIHHEMSRGNISVKLNNVTEQDSGEFTLIVLGLGKGHVLLVVESRPAADDGSSQKDGDNETQDGDEKTNNDQTGLIVSSVLGPLLFLIAASAVIICYSKRWRREKNKQEDDQQREEPDTEEKKPLNNIC